MVLWNREVRIVDVNHAFVRMYGYRARRGHRPGLLGASIPTRTACRGRVGHDPRGARRPRRQPLETQGARTDGSRLRHRAALPADPLRRRAACAGGGPRHHRTQARRAALRDSEAQYRAIFNASADALVLRDADFRIVDVNATYERMSGMPHAEVLGVDRVIANPAEVAPTHPRAAPARAGRRDRSSWRCRFVHRDGTRYEIELRGVPIQPPRPAARAVHRPRHHRAQARRAGAARQRRAVPRDLQRLGRRACCCATPSTARSRSTRPTWRMSGYSRDEVLGATAC